MSTAVAERLLAHEADSKPTLHPSEAESGPEAETEPPRARWWLPHRRIAAAVGLIYFTASMWIFRDVITAIPSVMAGDNVVVGDELVPYFNPTSQLFEQAKGEFSELTHGYEFRVRYSFLTTWLRHYQVLPFAVLIILPSIVWAAYLITAWFMGRAFRSLDKSTIYLAVAFPTALIYMIMIYAKVTHFYTLVFGLMLMTVSAFTMLDALLFRERQWLRVMAISCVVSLLNPAVHYLILFALFLSLTVATLLLGEVAKWIRQGVPARLLRVVRERRAFSLPPGPYRIARARASIQWMIDSTAGRCVVAMGMFVLVAMLPYALFVKFIALRGVPNLSETVPGDYYFIRDASVSLVHILSWDLAGIMDKIQFGDYLSKVPRRSNIVYTALILVPLAIPRVRRSLFLHRPHRQLLGVIYVNTGFAMWATVGYGDPEWMPTFHRSLSAVTRTLYATDSPIGDLTLTISSTIVQVLRFPHRFQLILFMLGPLLMAMPVAWAIERLHGRVRERRAAGAPDRNGLALRLVAAMAVGSVFFVPFLASAPYRNVYGSGNFVGFFSAYPVEDLHELKDALVDLPVGKSVVLPPTETAKKVVGPDGVPHKFIDKFYIYFLDEPSFYYGLTGDSGNKFEFFLFLRALYYEQDWWINIARDIQLEYIVLNKQIQSNKGIGAEYLPGLEEFIREQIEEQPDYVELLFENDGFALYRLTDPAPPEREVLLFDTSWKDFLDIVFARLDLSNCYDLQYISRYEGTPEDGSTVHLVATDETDSAIDLWAIDNQQLYFGPSSQTFAFNPDVIASSYYLSPMFRLYLFFSDTKWNRNEMITPGLFGTLRGSFIGVPRPTQVTVPVAITEPGTYRVLLRSAATANELSISSSTLGYDESFELRSPPDALQIFDVEEIYEPDRVPTDTSAMSVTEFEQRVPTELVPVNLRYAYHDLGTVEATAGLHAFKIDKADANPMLFEGIVMVPEDEYRAMSFGPQISVVSDVRDLGCSEVKRVRIGTSDGAQTGEGEGVDDLTQEQVLELMGVDELVTPNPDGLGLQWYHALVTVALLVAGGAVVRRHALRDPDAPLGEPGPLTGLAGRRDDDLVGSPRAGSIGEKTAQLRAEIEALEALLDSGRPSGDDERRPSP